MKGDRGQPIKSVIPEMLRSERSVDWFYVLVYWWEIRDGFTTAVNPAIVSSQGDQLQLDKKLAGKNEVCMMKCLISRTAASMRFFPQKNETK
jgi:hypothetical protein